MSEDRSVLSRSFRPADQVLRYGPGADHIVEVRLPRDRDDERPVVLLIHGGFWRPEYDRTHTGPMAQALAEAGWAVATMEYRRRPADPDSTVQDVALAIEQVPRLITHHNGKLLLLGHSAGGHLALWAAATGEPSVLQGVVALAPVADLQMAHARALGTHAVLAFLGAEPQQRRDLDPACLPAPRVPSILLHGEADEIVPLAVSESYFTCHPGTTLVRLAAAGHFALIDPLTAAWQKVLAALDSLVR